MSANKNNLLLLFDRPSEPVFVPKGENKTVFDVPDKFLTDRYRPIGTQLANRFNADTGDRVPVRNISIPNLDLPLQLKRRDIFSLFIPKHRKMAGKLIDIFVGMRNVDDLQSIAVYCRDRINPYMFNYCLSVALLHREDTKDLPLPSFIQSFPDKYVDSAVFSRAREEATVVPEGSRTPIIIPKDYTASDLDEEHRVAYFREDMGINLHHWHWHLVYPFESANRDIVNKDRRGELFYYMHEQIVARYNFERFSNNLGKVKRFNDLRQPIAEGYFPKMDSLVASRAWPPRFANTRLADINRSVDQIRIDLSDMEQWRDRYRAAVEQGFVTNRNGQRMPLTEEGGIDILGNIIESSSISPNQAFYGDLHNMGHVFIALAHDPDHRHLETFSVMGDSGTAMRDPIFYRWHAYIDDLFQLHKGSLPRYTVARLDYPGITVSNVQVTDGGTPNNFRTFWQQSDIDLSRGMDFTPRGAVFARFTHLQHEPFAYNITVNNASGSDVMGTVRIFMAPKFDERGLPMQFRDQRLMMIELDKFATTLRSGQNSIQRRSSDSSVTIPFERTFRSLDANRPTAGTAAESEFNFCGCGWPNHMLIPKGTPQGLAAELFVMVSNYTDDRVEQELVGTCNDSDSYCGIRDRLYPDRRNMGYPFDRMPRQGADTLADFLTPNMRVQDVTITFTDRTVLRPNTT
ncbi:prophenoloxidase 2 [Arctopsyche grandis]|uniref:prophenoloxidase 2 n=1 Tax=Arctopsyche grandis TaxID=121162 RepID=UPI00406D7545